MRDLRKIKLIALVVSITSCLLMFSVGFSTWYNVSAPAPVEPDTPGSFEAYDMVGIYMKGNDGMEMFKSSLLSFKTNEKLENTDSGSIKVHYVVPKSTLETMDGNFAVNFSLGYVSLVQPAEENGHKLFAHAFSENYSDNSFSVSVKIGENDPYAVEAVLTEDDEIICSYDFRNIDETQDFEFTVIYTFNIPHGINFKESFGQYLNGTEGKADATKFSASAMVDEIKSEN